MFKVTNISRGLAFAGLYSGESKTVIEIDDEIKDLANKGLLYIEEVSRSDKKKTNISKDEV